MMMMMTVIRRRMRRRKRRWRRRWREQRGGSPLLLRKLLFVSCCLELCFRKGSEGQGSATFSASFRHAHVSKPLLTLTRAPRCAS